MKTPEEYQAFLRTALNNFLAVRQGDGLEPARDYLPYNAVDFAQISWLTMRDVLVKDELRELTNSLNAWLGALKRWHAWSIVCLDVSDEELWDLEIEFIKPLATSCMLQPSAVRDLFTLVVTNGMHQVRLGADTQYEDRLPLDRNPWDRPLWPSRRMKEQQLATVLAPFPEGGALLRNLRCLDDAATREATADFRNRVNHAIAPAFTRGITRTVTRQVVMATQMVDIGGGRYDSQAVDGKTSVRYSYGGQGPLDLGNMRQINLAQFARAVICFELYLDLLRTNYSSDSGC